MSRVTVIYLKWLLFLLICSAFASAAAWFVGPRWPALVSGKARTAASSLGLVFILVPYLARPDYFRSGAWRYGNLSDTAERLEQPLTRVSTLVGLFLMVFAFFAGKLGN